MNYTTNYLIMYIKKILLAVALIGLLIMAGFAYYVYSVVFIPNTAFNNNEAHVYIPTGAKFSYVMEELSPLLKDPESFEAVANRKGYSQNIKSGHFIIKKSMNNNDIINSIRVGNVPILIKFNNQERLENLAGKIAQQLEGDSLSFLNAFRNEDFLKTVELTQDNALSMYIPNSYEIYWNISAEKFQERMYKEYQTFWNVSRTKKASSLNLSKEQVISLAAIVQKETAKVDERSRVAGVYINRINSGMLLQADPTVIYAKKMVDNNFDQEIKRVLYKDLDLNSPYNTYQNIGVPPGPITMPDISSIDAVLNYEKHKYYYFVADINNFGYHKFAKTLTQHNRNKREYVRWISMQNVNR